MPTLDLDFFGVGTRIVVPDPFDEQHFRYYFGDFAAELTEPAIELHFATRPEGSFIKTLMDGSTLKVTMIREDAGAWRVHDAFTARSTQPSPLPPFRSPHFRARFVTVHAASLVHPRTGDAVLLAGPSFSGKSVLTLELLRNGWGFLSDDMSIVEREPGSIWAFPRPIGVREHTRRLLPWIGERLAGVEGTRRISTPSGETTMVRVDDLFPGARRRHAKLRHFIELDRRDDASEIQWSTIAAEPLEQRLDGLLGVTPSGLLGHRVTYHLEHHAARLAAELESRLETVPC